MTYRGYKCLHCGSTDVRDSRSTPHDVVCNDCFSIMSKADSMEEHDMYVQFLADKRRAQ
jgi:DNA-directed RNA polymerase subunit RPC12/RpoP